MYAPELLLIPFLSAATAFAAVDEIVLIEGGRPRAVVYAPGEGEWAGRRLADRLEALTKVRIHLEIGPEAPPADGVLIAVGTPGSCSLVASVLREDPRLQGLGDEGFILKTTRAGDRPLLVAAGRTVAGVNHAVSELVSWRLGLSGDSAVIPADLDVSEVPALKYRIVWTSDGQANWSESIEEMHTIQKGTTGTMVVPYTRDGFLTHFKRNVDYLSDHKINGCILWGFLRDDHGGLETGRELSRYARQRNVRMLPGVCTQAAYGGFIYSQTDRFSLAGWLKEHPELRGMGKDGKVQMEAICPSKPANQQWLREGTEWLFKNLPDIGGVNLENGDLMECYTPDCVAAKARPENDPNFFWDMMATEKPVVETAARLRPDAWITFATYTGFREPSIRHLKDSPRYPPRFLEQYPPAAICQWTFTGLTTPELWPPQERPPKAAFTDHIGLLHHGSIWGTPVDPARWWAAPGAMLDDCSSVIQFTCARARGSGFSGVVITAQTGTASPANELNFLALEYFGWHPERTYEDFVRDRLTRCYGGPERARRFLKLLHNTTRIPAEIDADGLAARGETDAADLDVVQRTRWRNLAGELARRKKLAEDPATFKASAK